MGSIDPIAREQEGETQRGQIWGVVHPKWNGVAQARSKNTRYWLGTRLRSRFGRVSKGTEIRHAIQTVSLNTRSGQVGGLEADLCTLQHGNIGIGVLQEMNLT